MCAVEEPRLAGERRTSVDERRRIRTTGELDRRGTLSLRRTGLAEGDRRRERGRSTSLQAWGGRRQSGTGTSRGQVGFAPEEEGRTPECRSPLGSTLVAHPTAWPEGRTRSKGLERTTWTRRLRTGAAGAAVGRGTPHAEARRPDPAALLLLLPVRTPQVLARETGRRRSGVRLEGRTTLEPAG